MAFAGEEIGLLGSSQWVNHPTLPLENAVAMINMDMIGRVNGSKLYIGGTGTGSTFEPMLKEIAQNLRFQDRFLEGWLQRQRPHILRRQVDSGAVLLLRAHGDYHKPSDTWDKISGPASAKVVNLVYDVATSLVSLPIRGRKFVKVQQRRLAAERPGGRAAADTDHTSVRFPTLRRSRKA